MKFDAGYWQPLRVRRRSIRERGGRAQTEPTLVVTGYSHEVITRDDYLHGSLTTARFTSPMPNVIRVQLTHFKGRRDERARVRSRLRADQRLGGDWPR